MFYRVDVKTEYKGYEHISYGEESSIYNAAQLKVQVTNILSDKFNDSRIFVADVQVINEDEYNSLHTPKYTYKLLKTVSRNYSISVIKEDAKRKGSWFSYHFARFALALNNFFETSGYDDI